MAPRYGHQAGTSAARVRRVSALTASGVPAKAGTHFWIGTALAGEAGCVICVSVWREEFAAPMDPCLRRGARSASEIAEQSRASRRLPLGAGGGVRLSD